MRRFTTTEDAKAGVCEPLYSVQPNRRLNHPIRRYPQLRFMGSKFRLLPWIHEVLSGIEFDTVLDAFSGSGCVAYLLKALGKEVTANDRLNFSTTIATATIENLGIGLTKMTSTPFFHSDRHIVALSRTRSRASSTRPKTCGSSTAFPGIFGSVATHTNAPSPCPPSSDRVQSDSRGAFSPSRATPTVTKMADETCVSESMPTFLNRLPSTTTRLRQL